MASLAMSTSMAVRSVRLTVRASAEKPAEAAPAPVGPKRGAVVRPCFRAFLRVCSDGGEKQLADLGLCFLA